MARVRRTWSEPLQLDGLIPAAGSCVLLDWTVDPYPDDGGVPEPIRNGLSDLLCASGNVAFRWQGDATWSADDARLFPPPARGLFQRVAEHVTNRWPVGVVVTRSAAVAAMMFDYDWELQGQAALLFAAGAELPPASRSDLATRREWADFEFRWPVSGLLVPVVDGCGVLMAMASGQEAASMQAALGQAFERQGVKLLDEAAP